MPRSRCFSSQGLAKALEAYRLINDLKFVLPILTLVLPGAAWPPPGATGGR